MKTIAIVNSKGGVGKTTLAITLAAGLAATGKKVVLVDTDPQGNVAGWFGMSEESGVFDLLIKERPIAELLRLVPQERWWPDLSSGVLAILPGNSRTTTAGLTLAIEKTTANKLKNGLAPLAHSIDYVILDTSPTVTEMMANVFAASDGAIIPTQTARLSVNGVHKTMGRIEAVHDQLALPVLGIQPTMHYPQQVVCKDNLAELTSEYPDLVWSPIPKCVAWEDAAESGMSIFVRAARRHSVVNEATLFVLSFLKATQAVL
jgi:chromosome partitioning protein